MIISPYQAVQKV